MAGANQIDVTIRLIDQASQQMKNVGKETNNLTKVMGGLQKAVGAIAFAALAKEAGKFMLEATKLSARVETLGVVTEQLAKNAGISTVEINHLERAVKAQGITTERARTALAKMMQAQLDVADAADLARMAQDAAVIAGTNSSEAFERLVNVITTGNVRMARTMGLQVDFNAGYEAMAEQLGKTTAELTATEKATSRQNTVLEEAVQIEGTYSAAMKTTGKQLTSTARYVDEFKRAVGEGLIPVLGGANRAFQNLLGTITDNLDYNHLLANEYVQVVVGMEGLRDMNWQIARGEMEKSDVIQIILDQMYEYETELADINVHEMRKLGLMQEVYGITDDLATQTKTLTESQMLNSIATKIMAGASEEEITMLWGQYEALVANNEALDAMIDRLRVAGLAGAGVAIEGSWSGKTISKGTVSAHATGGPLSPFSLVGEAGPEYIVGGHVIPAKQTRQMMNAGIRPGKRFLDGGFLGSALPDNAEYVYYPENTSDLYTYITRMGGSSNDVLSNLLASGGFSGSESSTTTAAVASATRQAAAVSGSQMASAVTAQSAKDTAMSLTKYDEMIALLKGLPTTEDMNSIMKSALEQVVL